MKEETGIKLYLVAFCLVALSLAFTSLKDAYARGFTAFLCLFAYCFLILIWEVTKE